VISATSKTPFAPLKYAPVTKKKSKGGREKQRIFYSSKKNSCQKTKSTYHFTLNRSCPAAKMEK